MERCVKSIKKGLMIALLACLGAILPVHVIAAIIWCNPVNMGTVNGTSKATGYTSIWTARSHMSPGDTLIIADGDWSSTSGMTIDNNGYHLPISGTSYSNMTTIRAETDWGVRLAALSDQGTGGVSYVKIQGIVFNGFSMIYKWQHCKFIRCGFFGPKQVGNVATLAVGGSNASGGSSYILVEECIAWGGGRYNFLDYYGNYNIYRRNVVRHDWYVCDSWAGQESSFRGYGSTNTIWQNNISIDSDRSQFYCAAQVEHADFWIGDQTAGTGNVLAGNISMRGHHQAYYLGGTPIGTGTVYLSNNIALGPYTVGMAGLTGALTIGNIQATVSNLLVYNVKGVNQHFSATNKTAGANNLTNSIGHTVGPANFGTLAYVNHNNDGGGSWGAYATTIDARANGLLYPVRVESGSRLAGLGTGGSQVGPTILKKVGVSGTCRDEAGYDTVTGENLWPFPNENVIKQLLLATVDGVSGSYGFTTGTSIDGSPQTLTKYIWEYLGNKIPNDVYSSLSAPDNLRVE